MRDIVLEHSYSQFPGPSQPGAALASQLFLPFGSLQPSGTKLPPLHTSCWTFLFSATGDSASTSNAEGQKQSPVTSLDLPYLCVCLFFEAYFKSGILFHALSHLCSLLLLTINNISSSLPLPALYLLLLRHFAGFFFLNLLFFFSQTGFPNLGWLQVLSIT